MARVFAYLMHKNVKITDDAIFQDVSKIIHQAIEKIYKQDKRTVFLSKNALRLAIEELS